MALTSTDIDKAFLKIANTLRGSTLRSHDSNTLVLGLIFLRCMEFRFVHDGGQVGDKLLNACFSGLLSLPPHHVGEGINRAMRLLEADKPILHSVLPQTYDQIETHVLLDLLHILSAISVDAEGKVFADLFDGVLSNVARQSGQAGDEFCTHSEVSRLLAGLVKPQKHMTLYDPCAGSGGILLEARDYATRVDCSVTQPVTLFGQERVRDTWALCQMRMLIHGVTNADVRLGDTLTSPGHIDAEGHLRTFDRVMSNPPFSLSPWHAGEAAFDPYNRFRYGLPGKGAADFAFIQHILASLAPEGAAAVVVSHGVLFRGGSEGQIRQAILEADLVEAVIGLPPGLLYGTSIPVAILVFNRNKPTDRCRKVLFINADRDFAKDRQKNCLRPEDVSKIVDTFTEYSEIERYSKVVDLEEIQRKTFNLNIPRYVDSSPLAALVSQYSQYAKFTLKDIALQINSVNGTGHFEHIHNSVYIPKLGSKKPTADLANLHSHHSNYFQVVLSDQALSEYVAQFLGSSAGQHALSLVAQGSVVKRLSKSELYECMVAVPDLDTQRAIVSTHLQLAALKDAIDKLDQELSLNPTGKGELKTQVESLLAVMGQLSEADDVRRIVRQGESKTVEFKEVFSIEVKEGKKEQFMQTATFKTIVAFLNSEGGHLLVGVNDKQGIVGVNSEIKRFHKDSLDEILKHFKNLLKSRVGEGFYPFINYGINEVDECKVFVVACAPPLSPCFLDTKDFFVRTNPASDKLEGPKLVQYLAHRFNGQATP